MAEIPDVSRWREWLPYEEEEGENGLCRRRLKPLGKYPMANEPGVTTLCIREDLQSIFLWTQNRLALCKHGAAGGQRQRLGQLGGLQGLL